MLYRMKEIKNVREANKTAKNGGRPVPEAKYVSQAFSNNIQNITADTKEQVSLNPLSTNTSARKNC